MRVWVSLGEEGRGSLAANLYCKYNSAKPNQSLGIFSLAVRLNGNQLGTTVELWYNLYHKLGIISYLRCFSICNKHFMFCV